MLGTYFYHEILRKTVISFGTLFNDIRIRHKDSSGSSISEKRVPLAYGPMQKFLARLEQQADLNRPVQKIELPRMSFETNNIMYDATRKAGITQTFKVNDGNNLKKVFMPVPYNVGFELNILTKLNDDALQIVEQILPYFQPSFNLSVDLVSAIGEKRDIPIVLDSISFDDQYEGDFSTRRALIYTMNFTAKTYLFGPIAESTEGLIKKVQVDYHTNIDRETARRELRYTATPKALKDYDNDASMTLIDAITKGKTRLNVNDTSMVMSDMRFIIDEEIFQIKEVVNATTLLVYRGWEDTTATSHLENSVINLLTGAGDDDAIVPGDDFGFSGYVEDFTDSREYSEPQQSDV